MELAELKIGKVKKGPLNLKEPGLPFGLEEANLNFLDYPKSEK